MATKRERQDPFTAGKRSYRLGVPFDADFGSKFKGWGAVSAQCLYESGRLKAAEARKPPGSGQSTNRKTRK
jgi:hypothetical protein